MKTRKHIKEPTGTPLGAKRQPQPALAVQPAAAGAATATALKTASAGSAAATGGAARDLSSLSQVELNAHHSAMFAAAKSTCGGSAAWRHRKLAEALELLALAQLSPHLLILYLDLTVDLRVALLMRVTVPCLSKPNGPLEVGDTAHLGLVYREESLVLPQPGFSFVQILAPRPVWHPNVSPDPTQVLCLGPRLAAGIPLREIILMTYGALTMMTVQIDPANSAGVFNPAAADWFQRNPGLIPLSREPFLKTAEVSP
jgi:hypothetical protein